jgi:hypothetical protein
VGINREVSEECGNTLFGTIRGHGEENQLAVTASSTTSHQGIAIGVWDANELGPAETTTNLHIRYDLGTRSSDVLVNTAEGRKWISSVHFASIDSTTSSLEPNVSRPKAQLNQGKKESALSQKKAPE